MTISTATEDDLDALCGLFIEAGSFHQAGEPDVFLKVDNADWLRERPLESIIGEDASILVAEERGQVIGFIQIVIASTRDIPVLVQKRFAAVENLVITEAFRGKGIGRALMEAAHQWALDKGLDEVQLTVWEFNEAARGLYESLGYETASRKLRKRLR